MDHKDGKDLKDLMTSCESEIRHHMDNVSDNQSNEELFFRFAGIVGETVVKLLMSNMYEKSLSQALKDMEAARKNTGKSIDMLESGMFDCSLFSAIISVLKSVTKILGEKTIPGEKGIFDDLNSNKNWFQAVLMYLRKRDEKVLLPKEIYEENEFDEKGLEYHLDHTMNSELGLQDLTPKYLQEEFDIIIDHILKSSACTYTGPGRDFLDPAKIDFNKLYNGCQRISMELMGWVGRVLVYKSLYFDEKKDDTIILQHVHPLDIILPEKIAEAIAFFECVVSRNKKETIRKHRYGVLAYFVSVYVLIFGNNVLENVDEILSITCKEGLGISNDDSLKVLDLIFPLQDKREDTTEEGFRDSSYQQHKLAEIIAKRGSDIVSGFLGLFGELFGELLERYRGQGMDVDGVFIQSDELKRIEELVGDIERNTDFRSLLIGKYRDVGNSLQGNPMQGSEGVVPIDNEDEKILYCQKMAQRLQQFITTALIAQSLERGDEKKDSENHGNIVGHDACIPEDVRDALDYYVGLDFNQTEHIRTRKQILFFFMCLYDLYVYAQVQGGGKLEGQCEQIFSSLGVVDVKGVVIGHVKRFNHRAINNGFIKNQNITRDYQDYLSHSLDYMRVLVGEIRDLYKK